MNASAMFLAFFESQVRGVKFYDLREAGARWGTSLRLVKEPSNPHDPLCVAAWVPGSPSSRPLMLGHVAKEAARWLSQLLRPPYKVTRFVIVLYAVKTRQTWYLVLTCCMYMYMYVAMWSLSCTQGSQVIAIGGTVLLTFTYL